MRSIWSISTHKLYRVCPRKFYFTKIVASPTSNDDYRWKANYLSKLQTLSMLAGDVVHRTIRKFVIALNNGQEFLESEAKAYAAGLFNSKLAYSAERKYTTDSKTEAGEFYCALYEHEYDIPITDQMIQENLNVMHLALNHFYQMEIDTKQGQMKLLSLIKKAQQRSAEERNYSFEYEGWQIRPVFDLVLEFANMDRRIRIVIDWKIEKNLISDNSQQMQLYGYAVWKRWNCIYSTQPEGIVLFEVNLLTGMFKRHTFDHDDLIAIDDLLFESTREFNYILRNRSFKDFDIQEFGLTQNTNSCSYCNHKKLCVQKLQQEEKDYATDVLNLF
jgi:hypothetical protein